MKENKNINDNHSTINKDHINLYDSNQDNKIYGLNFPCKFPIKVIGEKNDLFVTECTNIISKHSKDFDPKQDITIKESNNNKYLSLTANIIATSKEQLDLIYQELNSSKYVKITI